LLSNSEEIMHISQMWIEMILLLREGE